MSSYIIFSCSIPDNAPQEKDVETQRLSQVLLSVAGIIEVASPSVGLSDEQEIDLQTVHYHPSCLTRGLPCIPDPRTKCANTISPFLSELEPVSHKIFRPLANPGPPVMKDRIATFIANKFANIQRKLQARIPQRPKRTDTVTCHCNLTIPDPLPF